MCLGVPALILEINGATAIGDIMGVKSEINVSLIKDLKPGDYVMLHAGTAIARISNEEAETTIEIMRELGGLNGK